MEGKVSFSKGRSKYAGDIIGIDWKEINFEQFHMGMNVELEHGRIYGNKTNVTNDNPVLTGRIALAHLLEIPDYYTRLKIMELKAEKYYAKKHK